jgi:hypothetical protein
MWLLGAAAHLDHLEPETRERAVQEASREQASAPASPSTGWGPQGSPPQRRPRAQAPPTRPSAQSGEHVNGYAGDGDGSGPLAELRRRWQAASMREDR